MEISLARGRRAAYLIPEYEQLSEKGEYPKPILEIRVNSSEIFLQFGDSLSYHVRVFE